jgi:hypothetical protein
MSSYLVKHASNSVPPMVTFRAPICGVIKGVSIMMNLMTNILKAPVTPFNSYD